MSVSPLPSVQAKLLQKAPFSEYQHLWGAQVVYADPTDPSTYPEGYFDVVYDNNGKDLKTCKPLIDHFRVRCELMLARGGGSALRLRPTGAGNRPLLSRHCPRWRPGAGTGTAHVAVVPRVLSPSTHRLPRRRTLPAGPRAPLRVCGVGGGLRGQLC